MENLFQGDCGQKQPSAIAENPWTYDAQFNNSHPELRLFTPENQVSALPELQLCAEKAMSSRDVGAVLRGVNWLLERDMDYGAPRSSQIGMSGGLLDSVEFPNNHKTLNVNYDDRSTGRIGSIEMAGRSVNFVYDGQYLSQIYFSGPQSHEPINFNPHDEPGIATSGDKRMVSDVAQFAREISRFLKS